MEIDAAAWEEQGAAESVDWPAVAAEGPSLQIDSGIGVVDDLHRLCRQVAGVLDAQLETLLWKRGRRGFHPGRRDRNVEALADIDNVGIGQLVDLHQPIEGEAETPGDGRQAVPSLYDIDLGLAHRFRRWGRDRGRGRTVIAARGCLRARGCGGCNQHHGRRRRGRQDQFFHAGAALFGNPDDGNGDRQADKGVDENEKDEKTTVHWPVA